MNKLEINKDNWTGETGEICYDNQGNLQVYDSKFKIEKTRCEESDMDIYTVKSEEHSWDTLFEGYGFNGIVTFTHYGVERSDKETNVHIAAAKVIFNTF